MGRLQSWKKVTGGSITHVGADKSPDDILITFLSDSPNADVVSDRGWKARVSFWDRIPGIPPATALFFLSELQPAVPEFKYSAR